MSMDSLWLILCGAGAIQSLFLSVYLFTSDRSTRRGSLLLSLLLFAISLRLIKSIGWYFFDIEQMAFLNMGFAAHGFIGPILVLYFLQKLKTGVRSITKFLILSPAVALIIASPFITLSNFWYVGGYKLLLYVTIGYLLWSAYLLVKLKTIASQQFSWLRNLYIGVALFCISYFTNYIMGLNSYMTGPIVYSLIIYYISYIVFNNPELLAERAEKKKYKNLNLTKDQIGKHREKVIQIMEEEKPYLKSDFSLSSLSEMTSIPKHMLSHFFSAHMNQNFSDLTNSYRVEEAKKALLDPKNSNHKIAFIAYDCGFHTLSAFNNAFKKFTSETPSSYRDKHQIVEL